jgi:hypothetical protein
MALDALGLLRNGSYAVLAVCKWRYLQAPSRWRVLVEQTATGRKHTSPRERADQGYGTLIRDRALGTSESAEG